MTAPLTPPTPFAADLSALINHFSAPILSRFNKRWNQPARGAEPPGSPQSGPIPLDEKELAGVSSLLDALHRGDNETTLMALCANDGALLGRSILRAADAGNGVVLRALLDLPPAVELARTARFSDGSTALMRAAGSGCEEALVALLPFSEPQATDQEGLTALHWAADLGHAAAVEILAPISDAGACSSYGSTALMLAAGAGCARSVRTLVLQPGSDVNARNVVNGQSALMFAAKAFDKDTGALKALLDFGADPHAIDHKGHSALHWAAKSSGRNGAEVVRVMLSLCDPSTVNRDGQTPLMLAAQRGAAQSVARLLPVSDPLAADHEGTTALMFAASGSFDDHGETVAMLLDVSDPRARDREGRTALIHAAEGANTGTLRSLLRVSDVNAIDSKGRCALDAAVESRTRGGAWVEASIGCMDSSGYWDADEADCAALLLAEPNLDTTKAQEAIVSLVRAMANTLYERDEWNQWAPPHAKADWSKNEPELAAQLDRVLMAPPADPGGPIARLRAESLAALGGKNGEALPGALAAVARDELAKELQVAALSERQTGQAIKPQLARAVAPVTKLVRGRGMRL